MLLWECNHFKNKENNMDINQFINKVIKAAHEGSVQILPICKRDAAGGCKLHFRLGCVAEKPKNPTYHLQLRIQSKVIHNAIGKLAEVA
jgi:hypothetical protein